MKYKMQQDTNQIKFALTLHARKRFDIFDVKNITAREIET